MLICVCVTVNCECGNCRREVLVSVEGCCVWKQLHLGVFTIGMGVSSSDEAWAINVHMCSSSNTYLLHRNCVIFFSCF